MRLKSCMQCEGPIIGLGLQRLCSECSMTHRWCNRCETLQEIDAFKTPGGTVLRWCYLCHLNNAKNKRQTPEGKMYEYVSHLVWKFGISRVQAQVYANQKACAVCARVPNERLRVDHNHVTGQIRGVVCRQCNLALSTLDGDPAWIDSLQRYLAQTNQR